MTRQIKNVKAGTNFPNIENNFAFEQFLSLLTAPIISIILNNQTKEMTNFNHFVQQLFKFTQIHP
jgi:hypothetical protein